MEAVPMPLHVPLSSPSSFPWVTDVMVHQLGGHLHSSLSQGNESFDVGNVNAVPLVKSRKRPAMLVLPEFSPENVFFSEKRKIENVEVAIQGREYCVFSKKGRREHMEDRYKVVTDISSDSNQAFFAVVDGHGGQAAADYVADNLGKNILNTLENLKEEDQQEVDQAIRNGYLETDRGFLSQGVSSGACAASVLIRNGELHAANVGDCGVVLSRRGLATKLTNDHHLSREDERFRIESTGGFVHSCNGVWRLQGTLAVSRAIGDLHLKEWIISEPEIQKVPLTSDCDFIIMASDGLWDKVSEQEAVDIVSREEANAMESCKKLVDVSFSRGNKDDITVIVINLQTYVAVTDSSSETFT
uniref:PPM-type phosphatase domain-containing protein n=1 Tax=Chenopodium quinoa TaxID=63459 RepID=A0A803LHD3_CHEQI